MLQIKKPSYKQSGEQQDAQKNRERNYFLETGAEASMRIGGSGRRRSCPACILFHIRLVFILAGHELTIQCKLFSAATFPV